MLLEVKLPLKPLDVECSHKMYTWYLPLFSVKLQALRLPQVCKWRESKWCASVKLISAHKVIRNTQLLPSIRSPSESPSSSQRNRKKKHSPCDDISIFFHEEVTAWAIQGLSKWKPISSCKTNKQTNDQPTNNPEKPTCPKLRSSMICRVLIQMMWEK